MTLKPCGTRSAYQRHLRRNEDPCEPCRKAHAEWQHEYRQRKPQTQKDTADQTANQVRRRRYMRAHARALRELARRHDEEFQTLRRAEIARLWQEEA